MAYTTAAENSANSTIAKRQPRTPEAVAAGAITYRVGASSDDIGLYGTHTMQCCAAREPDTWPETGLERRRREAHSPMSAPPVSLSPGSASAMDLKRMMDRPSEHVDNTAAIRAAGHSAQMAADVRLLEHLKHSRAALRADDPMAFAEAACAECAFLSTHYMEVFHKLVRDEIDAATMLRFIGVLRKIEDGELDQDAGSVLVGQMLKEMYLDSAVRAADALDAKHAGERAPRKSGKPVSWAEFKKDRL